MEIPSQTKLNNSVKSIPIEYFKWGLYPDHFKIDMPHRHEFSELLFFTKGGAIHEIDYLNYSAQPGTIHFIPKSTVHFLKRDIDSEGFTIAFDHKYFETNNVHKFISPIPFEPFQINFKENKYRTILDQSQIAISHINQNDSYFKEKCFLLSIELLMNTIASGILSKPNLEQDTAATSLVKSFQYLVQTNIYKHHNVAWYADQLQVSSKTLGNQIKRNLGKSPKSYLHQMLLISVKRNLIDTNKPIKQIAIEHNYNLSQLGKLFKKNVSFTMNEYRS